MGGLFSCVQSGKPMTPQDLGVVGTDAVEPRSLLLRKISSPTSSSGNVSPIGFSVASSPRLLAISTSASATTTSVCSVGPHLLLLPAVPASLPSGGRVGNRALPTSFLMATESALPLSDAAKPSGSTSPRVLSSSAAPVALVNYSGPRVDAALLGQPPVPLLSATELAPSTLSGSSARPAAPTVVLSPLFRHPSDCLPGTSASVPTLPGLEGSSRAPLAQEPSDHVGHTRHTHHATVSCARDTWTNGAQRISGPGVASSTQWLLTTCDVVSASLVGPSDEQHRKPPHANEGLPDVENDGKGNPSKQVVTH
ncbi:unnamed protein product [Protopolystoma xenopodis]|uniref:Uncharacterized protein n=1 Tax=Protopolystoma xenopodis TaxID=117903 RepID=A0A3S5A8P6_9PLAT|nr:unnamed protein product [Protopolystoma xenopodis]